MNKTTKIGLACGLFFAGLTSLNAQTNWDIITNTVTGTFSSGLGSNCISTGSHSFASGYDIDATGEYSLALGVRNRSLGRHSVTIGIDVEATANRSMVIGSGSSIGSWPIPKLINNISGSLMIGFNSDIPTLFVGEASGVGTVGKVGIGTSTPASLLHLRNSSLISGTALRADAINGHIKLFETDGTGPTTNFTQIERNGDAFHIYQNDGSSYEHVLTAKMNGNVGIGTTNPKSKLHVKDGVLQIDGNTPENWTSSGWETRLKSPLSSAWVTTVPSTENNRYMGIGMTNSGWYFIQSDDPSGTAGSSACYPFYVTHYGKVVTREVQVTLAGWCDYVFDEDYELRDLDEVKSFIQENKHLPEVPSEKEVLEDGVNLGEMDAILLKKVEELMLYTIQQEEKIENQQKQIDLLLEKSNQ